MELTTDLGRDAVPAELRACYGNELHEYLIAVGCGGSGGGSTPDVRFGDEVLCYRHQNCLAGIDITSGEMHTGGLRLIWYMTPDETRFRKHPFRQDFVYRVKGFPLVKEPPRRGFYLGDVWLREITAEQIAHPYLQGLIAKQYPKQVGPAEIHPDVMAQYEPELHEYLIAVTHEGSISAWGWQEFPCDHSIRAQSKGSRGIIDLTTGAQSEALTCVTWYLYDPPHVPDRIPPDFAADTIYRIKGYPPKKREPSDRLRFIDGVFVREILENNVQNAFLQKLIDDFNTKVTVQSDVLGELELNKSTNWYSNMVEMLGDRHLVIINGDGDGFAAHLKTAETIVSEIGKWDQFFRGYIAENLLEKADEMYQEHLENEEKELRPLTADAFRQGLDFEDLEILADGSYRVLYILSPALFDDDLPFVQLTGTIAGGVQESEIDYS
ncbi:MAG: DUF2262 domain-containing protein [Oscillospiraceae bacterium]|nr:DUF2262 domain-containing protein [Oscillospiraceae bacterium]